MCDLFLFKYENVNKRRAIKINQLKDRSDEIGSVKSSMSSSKSSWAISDVIPIKKNTINLINKFFMTNICFS
jgi:hypothetical protein